MLQSINYQQLAKSLLQTGLTTAELGRRIGLSQPAVSRLAAGITREVSAEVGVKLIVLAGGQVQLPPDFVADSAPPIPQPQAEAAEASHAVG